MNLLPKACKHCGATVGSPIVALREARGWSQGELAQRLGVQQGTVSRWEAGAASPRGEVRDVLVNLIQKNNAKGKVSK